MLTLKNSELMNALPLRGVEITNEPEVRFVFRLIPDSANTGARSFDGREILIVLNRGNIERVTFMNMGGRPDGYSLTVKDRELEESRIVLEDDHGLIRMILKADTTLGEFVVSINHPLNRYTLDPVMSPSRNS